MKIGHITQKTQLLWLVGIFMTLALSIYGVVAQVGAEGGTTTGTDSYTGANGQKYRITITYAAGTNNPAIIFVPGGGWLRVDRSSREYTDDFQRKQVAERGYTGFVIDYGTGQGAAKTSVDDLKKAISYVRDNAAKFKINPNKIALWGDSAGASTVVRTAARGNSGVAAVVGWSTPTNAIRDMFYNPVATLDAIYASQCGRNVVKDVAPRYLPFFDAAGADGQAIYESVMSGKPVSLDTALDLTTKTLAAAGINVSLDLPSVGDAITIGPNGIQVDQAKLAEVGTNIAIDQVARALEKKVAGLDSQKLVELGKASIELTKSVSEQTASGNGVSAETLLAGTTLLSGMNDVLNAVMAAQSDAAAANTDKPATTTTTIPQVNGQITKTDSGRSVFKDSQTGRESTFSIDGVMSTIEDYWDGKATLQEVDNLSTAYAAQPDSYIDYKNVEPLDLAGYNKALEATKTANKGNSFGSANWNPDKANANAQDAQKALARYVNYYQANSPAQPTTTVDGTQATDKDSSTTSSAITSSGTGLLDDVNPQNLSAKTLMGCMSEFIDMSPALFASPRTPPTFLAQGTADPLVPLDDAYQMRDKLRSMGVRSETKIIKNGQHMGYHPLAVGPSFNFLDSILHP